MDPVQRPLRAVLSHRKQGDLRLAPRGGPEDHRGRRAGDDPGEHGRDAGAGSTLPRGPAGCRSEERRVGQEGVRTWRSRWAPYPKKNKRDITKQGKTSEKNKK